MTAGTASGGAMVCGLIALACQAPQSLAPGPNAALVQTCAPWDGPAIALFLTDQPWDGPAIALFLTDQPAVATYPQPPYSAITIYRSIADVLRRHFDVSPGTPNLGQGQICPAVGDCRPAQAASVSFRGLNADSTVEVAYRLELTPDGVISGQRRARLYSAPGPCG